MGWNDHVMGPGYEQEEELDICPCKHGKRYDFKTGDRVDYCEECEKERR